MTRDAYAELVDQMTLGEQVSLLAGASFWQIDAIERLRVPAIKVSDGPNGARGSGSFSGGVSAASFPVGISLAATWHPELVGEVAAAIAEEARTKSAHVLLGPTANIHRSPLGGRNFESFSEDPWLAGQIGASYVTALQGAGIAAALKHFVGNESEFERMTIDSRIDERALREIYLRPFEIIVRSAKPWTVMASYNRLNGTYASENRRLLTEILRGEWGFDGVVMSDWTGTRSTAAATNAGLDLEMPGPTRWRGENLVRAAEQGAVSRTAIAASARRVVQLADRVDASANPADAEERAIDNPRHRELIRRAGAAGIVLLTNTEVLPLDANAVRSIAVIGPNASVAQIMGGGSSQINAHYRVSPFDGIRAAVPPGTTVRTTAGCGNNRLVDVFTGPMDIQYFANPDLGGDAVLSETRQDADIMWLGAIDQSIDFSNFSLRANLEFVPERSGSHEIGVVSSGPVRVLVNGAPVIDRWSDWEAGGEYFGLASKEYRDKVNLLGGEPCGVIVEMRTPDEHEDAGLKVLRLGIAPPFDQAEIERATELARDSDVAIVCVGLNGEWDTEGMDRPHMDLPGRQNELIRQVAAANPQTIVVLQSGGALTMPWLDEVAAVMQAWYPGQESGNAIADVLFGTVNPSGRLPQTFPRTLAHNPAALDYPGAGGVVEYGESIYAGYRGYEAREIEPLFAFGHGLSYTKFSYGDIETRSSTIEAGQSLEVEVTVTNTGARAGEEVVQLYVRDLDSSLPRPRKELKGFARIGLAPGQSGQVKFNLDMRSFAFFDDRRNGWVAEPGQFEIIAGAASNDIRTTTTVELTSEWVESVADAWRSAHV